ncbi:hypothetical protein OJ997_12730 [Solirubrobacter phytolaccae]|uniref:Uncharacterized protein n=1 Tax=Solirubrobacter phytolaccae TaxID=1404360 RepID=A0A9X3NA03_9ACTN|nr:hypothetical protein [Solirubrobacter phytolaccae]MDA0181164.1 hypothetical protein [Solirubrobacter phytolaccae]
MWACHGPNGQALTNIAVSPYTSNGGVITDGGCNTAGTDQARTLTAAATGSVATLTVTVPDGLNVKRVRLVRTANGLGGAGAASYAATYGPKPNGDTTFPATPLPDTDFSVANPEFAVSGAGELKLSLSCSATCTGSLGVQGVAFLVEDNDAPFALGVNRNNPVVTTRDRELDKDGNPIVDAKGNAVYYVKEVPMVMSGKDSGVGLDRAVVTINGAGLALPAVATVSFFCEDLSPTDAASNDRPLDRAKCGDVAGNDGDETRGYDPRFATTVKTAWRDLIPGAGGNYTRTVVFYDAAGNATTALENEPFEAAVISKPISTRTLSIGTDPLSLNENPNGPKPPGGGVQGAQRNQCRTPRLSVVLNTKPVRVTKGTPVLKYKKAYKFTGRLTCVIDGKRRSAPKRTKVSILNKVGKKTVRKPNTAIRDKGAVNLKLAFVSDRTVIFRYTNADGQKSEVKIKVRVTKKKK